MTAEQGYTTAMHDLVDAAKFAIYARDSGLCDQAGAERILREELTIRWQGRIERGELPPCYSAYMVACLADTAAAMFKAPAEVN